jgi:hypothetical protein
LGSAPVSLAASLEHLAALLEATTPAQKRRRILLAAAFLSINKRGKGVGPSAIEEGDELYVQGINDPASGMLSKDASQTPFGRALSALAAGTIAEIDVALYEKRWVTDGNPCDICENNALAGWIPVDEEFASGDDEPEAHPNCRCGVIYRPYSPER